MSDTVSPIDRILAARAPDIAAREAKARARADMALAALEKAGISAWIVGSLARGNFGLHSDVDFVVDGDQDTFWASISIIEEAMGSFPFDIIPYQGVPENQRQFYVKSST
jgi:predicted nucleotidyltransferase